MDTRVKRIRGEVAGVTFDCGRALDYLDDGDGVMARQMIEQARDIAQMAYRMLVELSKHDDKRSRE